MVRTKFLHIEFALLGAVQLAGVVSAIVGLWPASAQVTPPRAVSDLPEAALGDHDIVQDFMAALPASDPIPRTFQYRSSLTGQLIVAERPEQDAYFHRRSWVTAHRFLTDKWRGGRAMSAILAQVASGFPAECAAKGGKLEPHSSTFYLLTQTEIRPKTSDHTLEVCMRGGGQALGALLIETNRHSFRDRDSHVVVTYHPSIVVTQATLDRQAADRAAAESRQEATRRDERSAVARWRMAIGPGTETSCGPVLRVSGDMIELVYFRDRQPRWYRRSELWPTPRDVDGRETCR